MRNLFVLATALDIVEENLREQFTVTALSEEMLMFRIGRDEFVVVTGYTSVIDAEKLAQKITSSNGNTVLHESKEIPLSMRIGINKIPNRGLSYKEVLDKMLNTIQKVKQKGVFVSVCEE